MAQDIWSVGHSLQGMRYLWDGDGEKTAFRMALKEADPSQRPTALGALLQLKELKQKCFDSKTGIGGGKCASE
ncbi:hypothetical protein PI124_g18784 [Phytophthora idaei]|nr:hypothetical protein PI125_g19655 [Phytophthora idaei]KAG3135748.1 hypothetical protein PI126_g18111 [Phytophthora idaei]KAG3236202.1 hypothetical protein PI124_g18784 [Phytophthora idaei]